VLVNESLLLRQQKLIELMAMLPIPRVVSSKSLAQYLVILSKKNLLQVMH